MEKANQGWIRLSVDTAPPSNAASFWSDSAAPTLWPSDGLMVPRPEKEPPQRKQHQFEPILMSRLQKVRRKYLSGVFKARLDVR